MNYILEHKQSVVEIFDFFGRHKEKKFNSGYQFKAIPILTQLTQQDILIGLDELNKILPDTDQMKFDFIKGLSRFSKNKQLSCDPDHLEEVYINNTHREFDEY